MRVLKNVAVSALILLVAAIASTGAAGYLFYSNSRVDPVISVDAIIVLGGEHDGREEYAFELARQGVANRVVLSDPYWDGDRKMAESCAIKDQRFSVICLPPVPETTRGEAIFTRELASQNGWTRVLIISWRYHLPRARYIFSRCFDGEIVMRPVPRDYYYSLAEWEYTYLYQTVGFIKAIFQGSC